MGMTSAASSSGQGRTGKPRKPGKPPVSGTPGAAGEPQAGRPGLSVVDRYADLIDELVPVQGVTPPHGGAGFGRSALKFRNKIFAMLVRGRLVLKLPADRVEALVAAGDGAHFDANKGTPMREWFSLDPDSGLDWLPLAREALSFAGSDG
jgi:hypothetical protein